MRAFLSWAMLASARAFARGGRAAPLLRGRALRAATGSSNSYEMEGTLSKIGENQTFESGFNKVEFVVTTDDMYPQELKFDLFKDKVALIDGFATQQRVKVFFNIRGNEWKGRHFVNLQCWRLEDAAGGNFYYEPPPVQDAADADDAPAPASGGGAATFDAPFASYDDAAPPAAEGAEPKKDDVPF